MLPTKILADEQWWNLIRPNVKWVHAVYGSRNRIVLSINSPRSFSVQTPPPPTSMNVYMTYWLRLNTLHYNILNKCDDIIKLDIISGKWQSCRLIKNLTPYSLTTRFWAKVIRTDPNWSNVIRITKLVFTKKLILNVVLLRTWLLIQLRDSG